MRLRGHGARLARHWNALPPRTIRVRLTAIYGTLFLVSGAALLAITVVLASGQLTTGALLSVEEQGAGAVFIAHSEPLPSGASSQAGGKVSATKAGSGPGPLTGPPALPSGILRSGLRFSPQRLIAAAKVQSNSAIGTLLIESAIALAVMALLAVGLGWVVAGRALAPLREITATAQEISASNLHRRLALDGPDDELRRLGTTFDALLERLESAFTAQRQFADNVSHELRTPLTLERTLLEVALADPAASAEELRATCERVLAAGHQQERLIDALLMLSRSQRGPDRREPVDLASVAAEVLAALDPGGLTVEQTLEPARIDADPRLIERLAANLLANAVQHNHPGGRIVVTTAGAGGRAILTVANSGAAIAAAELPRLFAPFERLDGARTSHADGLGLGLSIVKAVADAHAATITTDVPAEGGLSISVSFPAAPRQPH